MIGLESVRAKLKDSHRPQTVAEAMRPIRESISPELRGRDALKLLIDTRHDPIAVLEQGHIVGLLYHADLMRWLALHQLERGQSVRAQ